MKNNAIQKWLQSALNLLSVNDNEIAEAVELLTSCNCYEVSELLNNIKRIRALLENVIASIVDADGDK